MAVEFNKDQTELTKSLVFLSQNQLEITKEFKNNVNSNFTTFSTNIGNIFKNNNIFSNLQNSLSNIFSNGMKAFTNPFKSIGNSFNNLKTKLSSLNPVTALKKKASEKISNVKDKIKSFNPFKLLGNKLSSDQKKFYKLWSNPKKIAKEWSKYNKQNNGFKSNTGKNTESAGSAIVGVIQAIGSTISKVGNALTLLLNPVGIGIALAIGLTPSVLIICGALVLLAKILGDKVTDIINPIFDFFKEQFMWIRESFGEPLVNIVTSVSKVIENVYGIFADVTDILRIILDKVKSFFDSPISSVASGVKGAVSKIFNKDETKKFTVEELLYQSYKTLDDNLFNINDKLLTIINGKTNVNEFNTDTINEHLYNIYSLLSSKTYTSTSYDDTELLYKLSNLTNSMEFNKNKTLFYLDNINNKMTEFINSNDMNKIIQTTFSFISNTGKSIFDVMKTMIKVPANIEEKQETTTTTVSINNSFDKIISSFETMRLDNNTLLNEIKNAILDISKNKIQIGKMNETVNKMSPTDNDKINDVKIDVKPSTDISEIINALNKMTTKIDELIVVTKTKNDKDNNGGGGFFNFFV